MSFVLEKHEKGVILVVAVHNWKILHRYYPSNAYANDRVLEMSRKSVQELTFASCQLLPPN